MTHPLGEQPEDLRVGDAQVDVPEWFTRYLRAATSRSGVMFNLSDDFPTWIADKTALLGLAVPIGQVIGALQLAPKVGQVIGVGTETTTSATFTNLSTLGPTVTDIADGGYLIFWTCAQAFTTSSGQPAYMGVSVNGAAVAAADYAETTSTTGESLLGLTYAQLAGGASNSIACKYRVGGGVNTASFVERRLVAIKVANP